MAPTNSICKLLSKLRRASAMAKAGKICPPVPPPLMRIYACLFIIQPLPGSGIVFFSDFTADGQNDADGSTCQNSGSTTHGNERQRLSGYRNEVNGHTHINKSLKGDAKP